MPGRERLRKLKSRRVVHKSTGGVLPWTPEPVDPVGNPPPPSPLNTVAHLVRGAVPVAHQNRSRRGGCRQFKFRRLSASAVVAQAHQESARVWFESSAGLLLDSICHRTSQQFAADAMRRLGAVKHSPLLFQDLDRRRFQRREFPRDRLRRFGKSLVLHALPFLLSGRHTHCSSVGTQPVIRRV